MVLAGGLLGREDPQLGYSVLDSADFEQVLLGYFVASLGFSISVFESSYDQETFGCWVAGLEGVGD